MKNLGLPPASEVVAKMLRLADYVTLRGEVNRGSINRIPSSEDEEELVDLGFRLGYLIGDKQRPSLTQEGELLWLARIDQLQTHYGFMKLRQEIERPNPSAEQPQSQIGDEGPCPGYPTTA